MWIKHYLQYGFLFIYFVLRYIPLVKWSFSPDEGKLDTESNSGEFWVLFGGFAPIVLWLYEGIRK